MKWFRLYSSVLNDPKVQRLSPVLFKHWVNILCVASENEPRGELPGVTDLAFALRVKPTQMRKILASLGQVGVIDTSSDGKVRVHNWTARQRESDNIAARVEKHRRRKDAAPDDLDTGNVTLPETLLKRSVDTDTEKETDTETLQVSGDVISTAAVVAPVAPPAAASTMNGHNHWTVESAKRTAEEVARKIRLPTNKVADLADYLKACPRLSHETVIGEARSYADWLNKAHKGAEARVFYNRWLKAANDQREQQQQIQMINGKSGLNGSHQQQHQQQSTAGGDNLQRPPDPGDALYQFNVERARSKLVS